MPQRQVGELFVGGQEYAFGRMLDTKDMDHLDGQIIECGFDDETGRWVFIRQRIDVVLPDYITIARCKSKYSL